MTENNELREILRLSMAENERLGPSVIADDATWSYHAVRDAAAIACRTHDTAGRRVTCFIQLAVSRGRDAVKDAATIAALLNPSITNEHTREASRIARADHSSDRSYSSGSTAGPEFEAWWAEFGPNMAGLQPEIIAVAGWEAARSRVLAAEARELRREIPRFNQAPFAIHGPTCKMDDGYECTCVEPFPLREGQRVLLNERGAK